MAGEIKEPKIEGKARHLSGWCGMPFRAVMQHRACPMDMGGTGGYEKWSCDCICHEEGYEEPEGVVSEPTPGFIIPRERTTPRSKPLTRGMVKQVLDETSGTRTKDRKPIQTATKIGTHWTTGGGTVRQVGATGWVEVPLEQRLKDRVKLTKGK